MQRTFLIGSLILGCGFAAQCFAQARGYVSGGVLHPPSIGALGRPVPASPGGYGYGYGRGARRGYGYGYGIAAYPVYIGGLGADYYPGYTDPSLAYGPGGEAPAAAAPPAPPVVINQYFGAPPPEDPNVQVYQQQQGGQPSSDAPSPASAAEPRTYLIAYKDHSVYSALAYWVEDHTLNYVTTQNTHNQADLDLIDVDLTKKLNQDRSMPFTLSPASH